MRLSAQTLDGTALEIVQSTRQSLVNRGAKALYSGLLFLAGLLVAAAITGTQKLHQHLWLFVCLLIALPILASLWLLAFNRGPSKLPEEMLLLDDSAVYYTRLGNPKSIPWPEFVGFEVSGWPLRRIVLRSKSRSNISIDYLALSRIQREKLLRELEARATASGAV